MYPETALVRQNFGQDNHLFHSQVIQKLREVFHNFSDHLVIRDQIVYQHIDELEKYRDSHILIIGGGPSTDIIDWLDVDYDFAWSMNHCFFNEKIDYIGVDFLTVGCSVDLTTDEFNTFLTNHRPILGFELHVKYYKPSDKRLYYVNEANSIYDNTKKICYQTKWYSQLGTGARQIIMASSLKPKIISFIGFDGPKAIYDKQHSFIGDGHTWESQHLIPGSIRHLSQSQVYERFSLEYQVFWEFVQQKFPEIKYNSIDRTNQYHAALQ